MTAGREAALERWCCRWARARGIVVSKLRDPTGAPDHVFWIDGGHPVLIEFKRAGLRPTELQDHYLDWFNKQGYPAVCVDSRDKFLRVMRSAGVST